MSKLIKTDPEYLSWIQEISRSYRLSQIKASVSVNRELLHFYWNLGQEIVERDAENRYGSAFYTNLSQDLQTTLPGVKGFSSRNLRYMVKFYHFSEKLQQVAAISQPMITNHLANIPWGHLQVLIDKYMESPETAWFYVNKIISDGWSRGVLLTCINSSLHLRQGKAQSSFAKLLPKPESELAQEITKDPYIFDFTQLTEPYKERELKKALISNLSRFLLELGSGFAYIGEEYRLKVGNTEQFIDLLFYNVKLHAYCVIEVKTGTFHAGDIGQLSTYMTAVNHLLKGEQDAPTIGLLICKDKDSILAQYALESTNQPIGVAEFQLTKFVPDKFKCSLPSIEDIETELRDEE